MLNGMFNNPTMVFFGKNTEKSVGEIVCQYADKVLLHYGGASAEKIGLLDTVRKSLSEANIVFYELGGVKPNPRLDLVYEGIKMCRENGIGFILAVGGGSVIDSAKAISIGAPNDDDVWDYFVGGKTPKCLLPVATILTIPGAGSESSTGTVITKEDTMEKLAYNDERCRPVFSILNPEITYSVPKYFTATGVVDAIIHIIERYFTNTNSTDVTDRMCECVIRSLVKFGKTAVDEPENYDARAEVMWACKVAHDGSLGFGREEDWASHMIEHELSAKYDVAHGAGLSVVVPAWMKYVNNHKPALFAQFAMRVFDAEYDFENIQSTIDIGIKRLTEFFESIDMPTTLRGLGIENQNDFDEMSKMCADHSGGEVGHFVRLDAKAVKEIFEIAF